MAIAFSLQLLNATNAIILDRCRIFLEKRHDFDDFPCILQIDFNTSFCDTCILNYMSIRYWVVTGTGRVICYGPAEIRGHSHCSTSTHPGGGRERAVRIGGLAFSLARMIQLYSAVKCTMKPRQKLGVTWGWWFLAIYEALSQKIVGWLWWTLLLATGFRVFLEVFLRVFLVFHGGSAFRKLKDDKNIHLEGKEVMWHSVVSRKPKNKSNR